MQKNLFRIIALAAGLMLASGCSSDSPVAPDAALNPNGNVPLGTAISSDIAASAGNSIASDLDAIIANQAAAVGSFAVLVPSTGPSFSDGTPAADPAPAPAAPAQPNCTAGPQAGVFYCVKEPGPGDNLKCVYSDEKKLYVCVKQEESAPTPASPEAPKPAPAPAPGGDQPQPQPQQAESCSYNAAAFIYSCTKSVEGKTVVKSYQFLDANGNPTAAFVRGTTESIHYLLKTDASELRTNGKEVSHSLRDWTVSGFLGPNRIWNGFGSSADTSSRSEELSTRTYTGSSVDTLKAVTFVDERAAHPYPLSGSVVRVVDYKAVSTGKQVETTTIHKRVVVTFNGTADVPISLGDYSCVLHLDTHKVDGCK
jgi:hypothetical protein